MMRRLFALCLLFGICAGALANGPSQAHFDLGRHYRHGPQQDSARAFGLIEQAASSGHAAAMFILSGMLLQGEGRPADPVAARRWLERAAELENPEALQQLAMNLQQGAGGYERDEARAAQLMRQVAHALTHRAHGH